MDPWKGPVRVLITAERAIFVLAGAMFFVAAFALTFRAGIELWKLIVGPSSEIISAGTDFLDVMLLVLMVVELAYTVIISLRGSVLRAEPFLLVGLIAVIRRMLVITIGGHGVTAAQPIELLILTAIVLVLVASLVVLRRIPAERNHDLDIFGGQEPD
jgi:uncharacterized membrane protein (DUF373 family)